MNLQKKVKIHNIGSFDVMVTIGQSDPSHIELPDETIVLKRGEYILIDTSSIAGCAKMYIWTLSKNLLWCGIVPITEDAEIPIIFDPDSKKVTYSGLVVPASPEVNEKIIFKRPVLRENFGEVRPEPQDGIDFVKVICILAVFIAIYAIYKWLRG